VGTTPRIELTEDDIAILRYIHRHRFVRADDLYRLFGERSPDKLSRRLTRLYRNKFLDRPIAQIDRFHDGGSKALVYGLDNAGARYLKDTLSVPITSSDWRGRNRSYTRENLDHTLAISRFMIDLELACRARRDISLIPLEEILAKAPEATRKSSYPGRWAVPVQWNGVRGTVHVIPDAIFGLRRMRENAPTLVSYYFLEIDRGTMTIAPSRQVQESDAFLYRATILRKLVTYAESWRQGLHKRQFGIGVARILTLTTSKHRANAMCHAARMSILAQYEVPSGLLLFGVAESDPLSAAYHDVLGVRSELLAN
jgi:hypothetical protein